MVMDVSSTRRELLLNDDGMRLSKSGEERRLSSC